MISRFTYFKAFKARELFLLIFLLIFSRAKFNIDVNLGNVTAIVPDHSYINTVLRP
jgi:hypothetical protein